jgi:hypothetical protein
MLPQNPSFCGKTVFYRRVRPFGTLGVHRNRHARQAGFAFVFSRCQLIFTPQIFMPRVPKTIILP